MSVATNRMLAFAEFLSDKFNVTIFALDKQAYSKQWSENVLVHYVQSNTWVDRLKSNSTDSKFKHKFKTAIRILLAKTTKNPLSKWQKECTLKLTQCHLEKPFDVVISSYAPQEAHLVALDFVKIHSDVKWIADMRDEMSKNPGVSAQLSREYREIESEINRCATALTTVSKPILDDFKLLCPDICYFEEIRNGFNHEYEPLESIKNEKFTLGYFGTFYGVIKPDLFFQALLNLLNRRSDFDFIFYLVGTSHNFEIPVKLKDRIIMKHSLPYSEAIDQMRHMDLNVLINPVTTRKGVYTGKLFDYISSGRPVFASVDTTDVAAELIKTVNAGYIAEFSDVQANAKMIEQAFDDWLNNTMPKVSEENRLSLHRKNQVNKLSKLIKEITS
jgi:glycosyltransferase involved in cell wall biosynthesis